MHKNVAVVTGSSSGKGAATARLFARPEFDAVGPGMVETPCLKNGMGQERYDARHIGYKEVALLATLLPMPANRFVRALPRLPANSSWSIADTRN